MSGHLASTTAAASAAIPATSVPLATYSTTPPLAPTLGPPSSVPQHADSSAAASVPAAALDTLTTAIYGLQQQMGQFFARLSDIESRAAVAIGGLPPSPPFALAAGAAPSPFLPLGGTTDPFAVASAATFPNHRPAGIRRPSSNSTSHLCCCPLNHNNRTPNSHHTDPISPITVAHPSISATHRGSPAAGPAQPVPVAAELHGRPQHCHWDTR